MRARSSPHRSSGQSLVEFAIVFPVVIAMIGAIVQFGIIFWAQNTLTQVARDTGRWAATQQTTDCSAGAGALALQANVIAGNSSLFGYTSGQFDLPPANVFTADAPVKAFVTPNAMAVAWVMDVDPAATPMCPPDSNVAVWHVTIKMNQVVSTFFPGMQFLPGLGACDSTGCHVTLSSTTQFRMEPAP